MTKILMKRKIGWVGFKRRYLYCPECSSRIYNVADSARYNKKCVCGFIGDFKIKDIN